MSASNGAQGQRHRVVVIGGGFGGLQAAKHLATAPVDLASSSAANTLGESMSGMQSQSIAPSRATRATARPSSIVA